MESILSSYRSICIPSIVLLEYSYAFPPALETVMKRIRIPVIAAALAAALWAIHPATSSGLGPGAPAPELKGGPWLGVEKPLQLKELRGKVVLLDMWTFG